MGPRNTANRISGLPRDLNASGAECQKASEVAEAAGIANWHRRYMPSEVLDPQYCIGQVCVLGIYRGLSKGTKAILNLAQNRLSKS